MKKLTLAVAVGSLGSMLLGLTQGCGTNEPGGKVIGSDAGDAGRALTDDDSGGGTVVSSRTPLGKPCLTDSDCGGRGITCLTSDSKAIEGGGPPNGMCVADCSTDITVCRNLDPSSICVGFSTTSNVAYCLQGCAIGPLAPGEEKCHKRVDVSCYQATTDTGALGPSFCQPQCRSDADCGTRKCDVASGTCKDAKDIGTVPLGGPCDAGAAKDPCVGFCAPLTSNDAGTGPGVCLGFCPIGNIGCGTDPASKAPIAAACLFGVTDGEAVGDTGLCGALCDCNDDCKAQGRVCRPFTDPADISTLGRAGYCGGAINGTTGKTAESIACGDAPRDAGPISQADASRAAPVDAGRDAR